MGNCFMGGGVFVFMYSLSDFPSVGGLRRSYGLSGLAELPSLDELPSVGDLPRLRDNLL